MSNRADLTLSVGELPETYRALVELEATSAFSTQPDLWFADLRPDLLPQDLINRIHAAKTYRAAHPLTRKTKTAPAKPQQLSLF